MKKSLSLGQVFLRDRSYIAKISRFLDIDGEAVCEIGPGDGALTEILISKAKSVVCVELDSRFAAFIKEKFSSAGNIKIIKADILKFPLVDLGDKQILVGNVPYGISNELIKYCARNRYWIKRAYFTLQKEFAAKLTASVSDKSYGYLSCYIQYYAALEILFDIPASAFSPRPKVDSSFVKLDFSLPFKTKTDDDKALFRIIRLAFNQRRKKIINSLPFIKKYPAILEEIGIEQNCRAENITLEKYIKLADKIKF